MRIVDRNSKGTADRNIGEQSGTTVREPDSREKMGIAVEQ